MERLILFSLLVGITIISYISICLVEVNSTALHYLSKEKEKEILKNFFYENLKGNISVGYDPRIWYINKGGLTMYMYKKSNNIFGKYVINVPGYRHYLVRSGELKNLLNAIAKRYFNGMQIHHICSTSQ